MGGRRALSAAASRDLPAGRDGNSPFPRRRRASAVPGPGRGRRGGAQVAAAAPQGAGSPGKTGRAPPPSARPAPGSPNSALGAPAFPRPPTHDSPALRARCPRGSRPPGSPLSPAHPAPARAPGAGVSITSHPSGPDRKGGGKRPQPALPGLPPPGEGRGVGSLWEERARGRAQAGPGSALEGQRENGSPGRVPGARPARAGPATRRTQQSARRRAPTEARLGFCGR